MRTHTISIDITCKLDKEYFKAWESLTDEQQAMFIIHHTRCDGGGAMYTWCADCHFCESYDEI